MNTYTINIYRWTLWKRENTESERSLSFQKSLESLLAWSKKNNEQHPDSWDGSYEKNVIRSEMALKMSCLFAISKNFN